MFATFVIAVLFLAAIGCLVFGIRMKKKVSAMRASAQADPHSHYHSRDRSAIPLGASVVLVVIALIVTAVSSAYTQDPGEAKVLRSFTGEVVDTDVTEGMGFKAPWVSTITYDVRNQAVSYIGDGGAVVENSKGEMVPVTGAAIVAQTKDGASATMDLVVTYSIDPMRVESIYEQYGSQANFESKLIQNSVKSVTRNIPLRYSTADLRTMRVEATAGMLQALNDRWEDAGVMVESVDLQGLRYSANVEASLEEVQEATNRVNRARAELETSRIDGDKTRVEAQAMADYDQIVRCGAESTTATEMVNGVETTVISVTPLEGEDCEDRLNDQVLTNKYIDALRDMATEGNLIVVPQGFNGMLNMPAQNSVPEAEAPEADVTDE